MVGRPAARMAQQRPQRELPILHQEKVRVGAVKREKAAVAGAAPTARRYSKNGPPCQ